MSKKSICSIILPLILFMMLAISIQIGITVDFEGWAYSETVEHMSPFFTTIVKGITHIGDPITVIVFCLLLIGIPRSRKTIALPVSITVISSSILNFVLKNIFTRERPDILKLVPGTSYSFPSGHAMTNAAIYIMLIFMIFKYIKITPIKYTLSALFILLTLAIGYSRVYLGVHYMGDVLGGWLIGFAVSVSVYSILENRKMKIKTVELKE